MIRFALLLLAALAACSTVEPFEFDADVGDGAVDAGTDGGREDASPGDDAAVDAGHDASMDAGEDASTDAGDADVEEPLPWPFFREGDECDVVSQTDADGTPMPWNRTCRRRYLGSIGIPVLADRFAEAAALTHGTMLENAAGLCSAFEEEEDASKRCGKGLFCLPAPGTCHRACDPDGDPCPPAPGAGSEPQECASTDRFPQPYCRWNSHL